MCFYGGHSTGYKLGNHPKNIEPCAHRARTVRAPCDNAPYVQKEYIDRRTYWHTGASTPGIRATTPSKPYANMLRFETKHHMSILAKFLFNGIPNLGKCWGARPHTFARLAPHPQPPFKRLPLFSMQEMPSFFIMGISQTEGDARVKW